MPRPARQVDVFTTRPFSDDPVAVVLDAEDLSAGCVHVPIDPDGTIRVGGGTVACVSGQIQL